MATTPNLLLTLLAENQNGAEILVNEALLALDAALGTSALTEATAPPGSPTNGTTRLVIPTATGAFAGEEYKVAVFWDGVWKFFTVPLTNHWSTTEVPMGIEREGVAYYSKIVEMNTPPTGPGYIETVAHGITGMRFDKPIKIEPYVYSSGATVAYYGQAFVTATLSIASSFYLNSTNTTWETNGIDLTGYAARIRLEYAKT